MRIPWSLFLCAVLGVVCSATLSGLAPAAGPRPSHSLAELKKMIEGDNRSHPVASIKWAEEALQELAAKPDPSSEIWFLTNLVDDLMVLSDYPKAETYLQQGRKLVARSHDQRSHYHLEMRGAALLLHTGKPAESKRLLVDFLPSLEANWSRNPQDRELGRTLGSGYRIWGMALQTMGQYSEAIGAYQKAQKVTEELGDRREPSIVLDQMGTQYALLDRLEEAVVSHQQAIQMAEALEDLSLQAAFHLDLANTYRSKNHLESQVAALNRALVLARKAENVGFEIAGMVNLADAYLLKKDYKAALQHADDTLKLPGVSEDPGTVAVCQVNRGIALNRLGRSTEGLQSIQDGLRYLRTTQDKSQIVEITGNLAEEYAFAGDYRRAFDTQRDFQSLSDDLKRIEDQKRIAEASAAFESDKKQIQIEGLHREHRAQVRLTLLWIALGLMGFSVAAVLLVGRKKLKQANTDLRVLNDQLKAALAEVRTLQGLIPICAHCKKIRDDRGYWSQMESYIQSRTEAQFTHGICPDCINDLMPEFKNSLSDKA
jgi:tetratricopeptide (TPR) repeat protein